MSGTIRVVSTASYRDGTARARWYERLKEFDGRPLDEFVASVEAEPPSTPDTGKLEGQLEPVSGWINFFRKEGVLRIDKIGAEQVVTFTLPKIDEEIVLTREDVLNAIADLDAGADHHFSEARGYELRHEGRDLLAKSRIWSGYFESSESRDLSLSFQRRRGVKVFSRIEAAGLRNWRKIRARGQDRLERRGSPTAC